MSRYYHKSDAGEHAVAAWLELLVALRDVHPRGRLTLKQWWEILEPLPPREKRVVILHAIAGLSFEAMGERLGVTRGRTDQLWRRALSRLTEVATKLECEVA